MASRTGSGLCGSTNHRNQVVCAEAATRSRRATEIEQAALGECLLAAIDIHDPQAHSKERLTTILNDARRDDNPHVEVFALDALAHITANAGDLETALELCHAADQRMRAAADFITDLDRTDAHSVRHRA